MPITLTGTRITVQYEAGDSKGYSLANPYSFDDIVEASNLGGWIPAVTKRENYFNIPYSVYVLGIDTYFRDIGNPVNIINFSPIAPNDYYNFYTLDAHIRFGIIDTTNKVTMLINGTTASGGRLYLKGDVILLNTELHEFNYSYLYGDDNYIAYIENAHLVNLAFGLASNERTAFKDVLIIGGSYSMQANGFYSVENLLLKGCNNCAILMQSSTNGVLPSIKIKTNASRHTMLRTGTSPIDKTAIFLDCEIDANKMTFYVSGSLRTLSNDKQFLQTTTNFIIKDALGVGISGAQITVLGSDNTILLNNSTDEDGLLTDIVTYFMIEQILDNLIVLDTIKHFYEPLKIIVSKSGFDDLEIQSVYITSGVKTVIRGTLKETIPPIYIEVPVGGAIKIQNKIQGKQ